MIFFLINVTSYSAKAHLRFYPRYRHRRRSSPTRITARSGRHGWMSASQRCTRTRRSCCTRWTWDATLRASLRPPSTYFPATLSCTQARICPPSFWKWSAGGINRPSTSPILRSLCCRSSRWTRRVSRPATRRVWYVLCLARGSRAICCAIGVRPSATIKHVRKRARRGYIRLCVNSVGEGRRRINGASFDRGPWYVELASLLSGRCMYCTAQCTFCRIAVRIRAV